MSKGSIRRKSQVTDEVISANWDAIFKKDKTTEKDNSANIPVNDDPEIEGTVKDSEQGG